MSRRPEAALAAIVVAAALALLAPGGGASPALANGVPVLVPLVYIEGLSNWGPQEATGELALSFAEGYARIKATGMPVLTGQRYQGWLVNSERNDAISVGRFNASPDLTVDHEGTLPAITDFGFDLFLITVEPDPDAVPQPTSYRSIGGYYSLLGEPTEDPAAAEEDVSDLPRRPQELPNTGDSGLRSDAVRAAALVGAMVLSLFVGMRLGRRRA